MAKIKKHKDIVEIECPVCGTIFEVRPGENGPEFVIIKKGEIELKQEEKDDGRKETDFFDELFGGGEEDEE